MPSGPRGTRNGPELEEVLQGVAVELARLDARAADLLNEMDPAGVSELVPDWEQVMNLPDPCLGAEPLFDDRRLAVRRRLLAVGSQAVGYYLEIAKSQAIQRLHHEHEAHAWAVRVWLGHSQVGRAYVTLNPRRLLLGRRFGAGTGANRRRKPGRHWKPDPRRRRRIQGAINYDRSDAMDYPKSVPSAGLVNGKFVDENPLMGTPGSLIPAEWGNSVTQEIINVIKAGDLAPDENKYDQLLQAIQSVTSKGWNQDLALPLVALPLPTVATSDGRLPVSPAAASTSGGRVSISAGTFISLGQEVVSGQLGRLRTFVTSSWSSADLLPSSHYFLRAQVIGGVLTSTCKGGIHDVVPESLKGALTVLPLADPSTALDMCLAWV